MNFGGRKPWRNKPKHLKKNHWKKFAEKFAGNFPKIRQTKMLKNNHPKSALQSRFATANLAFPSKRCRANRFAQNTRPHSPKQTKGTHGVRARYDAEFSPFIYAGTLGPRRSSNHIGLRCSSRLQDPPYTRSGRFFCEAKCFAQIGHLSLELLLKENFKTSENPGNF